MYIFIPVYLTIIFQIIESLNACEHINYNTNHEKYMYKQNISIVMSIYYQLIWEFSSKTWFTSLHGLHARSREYFSKICNGNDWPTESVILLSEVMFCPSCNWASTYMSHKRLPQEK